MTAQQPPGRQRRPSRPGHRRGRRPFLWVLVALLGSGAVIVAGAGWYFAGRIGTDALQVRLGVGQDVDLTMQGRAAYVTSKDPAAWDIIRADETTGVRWPGGYVQLAGPPIRRLDNGAVRHAVLLAGSMPQATVHGVLDRSAFPSDPRVALGRRVSVVRYPIQRGTAPAWFVPGTGATWAVLVHGKGTTGVEMLRLMRDTVAAGLPSLDISYRNDPGLPADPSGQFQYGSTEWRDLASAVQYAQAHGARRVVLVGVSMGAGIIASYLRHRPGAPVSALVLDSPMLSLGDTVRYGAAQLSVPVLGHVPGALTWVAMRIAALRYHVDWSATDYLSDSSWLRVPTLLFQGEQDLTAPVADSRRLAADHPRLVRLLIFRDAEHVASWNHHPRRYDAATVAFLVQH